MYQQPLNSLPVPDDVALRRKRTIRGLTIGCLIVPLSLVLYFGSFGLFVNYWSQRPFQNQTVIDQFQTAFSVAIGLTLLCIGISLLMFALHRNKLGLTMLLSFLLALTALGATGIASGPLHSHIGMTRTSFLLTSATVDNHTGKIFFSNPSDGITQILCVGVDQHCQSVETDSTPGIPSQLLHGLVIHPGQIVSVGPFDQFQTDVTYPITSQTTPRMNITILDPRDTSF